MDLECPLVPAKLAPERAEMVEAARHQGREPPSRFVLRLVELHRQIDVADLERAARERTKYPDLTNTSEVAALGPDYAPEQGVEPPRRFRSLHALRLVPVSLAFCRARQR